MSKILKKRQNKDASHRSVRRRNSNSKGEGAAGGEGGEKLGRQLEGLTLVGLTSMLKWVGYSADKGAPLTVSEQEIVIIRAGSLGR